MLGCFRHRVLYPDYNWCFQHQVFAKPPDCIRQATTRTDGAELKSRNRRFSHIRKAILEEKIFLSVSRRRVRPACIAGRLDRGNSNFDQRHRFVISGVAEAPSSRSGDIWRRIYSDWTLAPRIERSSGRPFRLLTRSVVPLGTPGSYASPDAQVGLAIPPLGSVGSLGRNTNSMRMLLRPF